MKHDQFTLPFLDTTIVAEGFGLYGGFPTPKSSARAQMNFRSAEEDEALDRARSHANHLLRRRITGSPAIAVLPRVGKRAQRTISPRSDS